MNTLYGIHIIIYLSYMVLLNGFNMNSVTLLRSKFAGLKFLFKVARRAIDAIHILPLLNFRIPILMIKNTQNFYCDKTNTNLFPRFQLSVITNLCCTSILYIMCTNFNRLCDKGDVNCVKLMSSLASLIKNFPTNI